LVEQTRHRIFDAISNDDHATVQSLVISEPKCMKERDPVDGFTPLMLAATKGDVFVTKLLLSQGSTTGAKDDNGWTGT
jgi:ankyrin repeat protein